MKDKYMQSEEQAITAYKDYLDKHISNVSKSFDLLVNVKFPFVVENSAKLKNIIDKHDESKYDKEEWVPYIHHFYPTSESESLEMESFDLAVEHHIKSNPHHWQFWLDDKGDLLNNIDEYKYRLYTVERFCDWLAMSAQHEQDKMAWWDANKESIVMPDYAFDMIEEMFKLMPDDYYVSMEQTTRGKLDENLREYAYAKDVTVKELDNNPVKFVYYVEVPVDEYGHKKMEEVHYDYPNINALLKSIRSEYGGFSQFKGSHWTIMSEYKGGEFYLTRNNHVRSGWLWSDVNGESVEYAIKTFRPRKDLDEDLMSKYNSKGIDLNQSIDDLDGLPAIELYDGSIIPIKSGVPHVQFIINSDIDINDIKSGGWIANGIYNPTETSDTEKYVNQQKAKQRMNQKRHEYDNKKINEEDFNVYHGTNNSFRTFSLEKAGKNAPRGMMGEFGTGYYFTSNIKVAKQYGKTIKKAIITLDNPFYTGDGDYTELFNKLKEVLIKQASNEEDKKSLEFNTNYWLGKAKNNSRGMVGSYLVTYSDGESKYNGFDFGKFLQSEGFDGIIDDYFGGADGTQFVVFDNSQIKLKESVEKINEGEKINQDKIEAVKEFYKAGDGYWIIDLNDGWETSYGTNYIRCERKKDCIYELNNFVTKSENINENAYWKTVQPKIEDTENDKAGVEMYKDKIKKGIHRPILINSDNEILDGNHTMTAYQELGIEPTMLYRGERPDFYKAVSQTKGNAEKAIDIMIKDGTAKPINESINSEPSTRGYIFDNQIPHYDLTPKNGYVYLFHNTKPENLESIDENGLVIGKHSGGYKDKSEEGIWCSTEAPKSTSYGGCTITFKVTQEEADSSKVNNTENIIYKDIPREDILFIDRVLDYDAKIKVSNLSEYVNRYGAEKTIRALSKNNPKSAIVGIIGRLKEMNLVESASGNKTVQLTEGINLIKTKDQYLVEATIKQLKSKTLSTDPTRAKKSKHVFSKYLGISKYGVLNFATSSETHSGVVWYQEVQFPGFQGFMNIVEQGDIINEADVKEALQKDNLKLTCDDPSFLYWAWKYMSWKDVYGLEKETRAPKRNNTRLRGALCKHLYSVMDLLGETRILKLITRDLNEWCKKQLGMENNGYQDTSMMDKDFKANQYDWNLDTMMKDLLTKEQFTKWQDVHDLSQIDLSDEEIKSIEKVLSQARTRDQYALKSELEKQFEPSKRGRKIKRDDVKLGVGNDEAEENNAENKDNKQV